MLGEIVVFVDVKEKITEKKRVRFSQFAWWKFKADFRTYQPVKVECLFFVACVQSYQPFMASGC